MTRAAFVKLVVVPLALLGILAGIIWYWTANRINIINDADFPLDDIVLEVKTRAQGAKDSVVLHGKIATLKSNQSTSYLFRENNVTVRMGFKLNGRSHEFEQMGKFVAGVTWELHVDSNGSVKSSKSFLFD